MKSAEFWKGFEFACQMLEDQGYTKSPIHEYNIADCLRAKMGRMPKSKIRKTQKRISYGMPTKATPKKSGNNNGGVVKARVKRKH